MCLTHPRTRLTFIYSPGSGKDDYCYSSSTQKQSIETITASRNTSVKQLSKLHAAENNFIKSPSVIEMTSATSRFPHKIMSDSDVAACLSKVVSGSEINIYSDECVQEIQLKIFPPSAAYAAAHPHCHARCKYCGNAAGEVGVEKANCLSIDVIQEGTNSSKSGSSLGSNGGGSSAGVNESEPMSPAKSLQAQFSHIAFRRTSSILHISIGNSSKIMKRRRRKRQWIFSRLFRSKKECCSPDGKSLHLSSLSALNVINDNMIISINKKNRLATTAASAYQQNNELYQNQLRSILDGDLEYGANELDFYMNEIKSREMG